MALMIIMFCSKALTVVALVCSVRGWWPALFFGTLHLASLLVPSLYQFVMGTPNNNNNHTNHNQLPLFAAACQLLHAVSMEVNARRHAWQPSQESYMNPIRAGMVSALFWILVYFLSELATTPTQDEEDHHHAKFEYNIAKHHSQHQEQPSIPRMSTAANTTTTTTTMPSSISSNGQNQTYQWIVPSQNTSSSSSLEDKGTSATISAICTLNVNTTATASSPLTETPPMSPSNCRTSSNSTPPCDDKVRNATRASSPSLHSVTPAVSTTGYPTFASIPSSPVNQSPLLDRSIPSFVHTTTDTATPMEVDENPLSSNAVAAAAPTTTTMENETASDCHHQLPSPEDVDMVFHVSNNNSTTPTRSVVCEQPAEEEVTTASTARRRHVEASSTPNQGVRFMSTDSCTTVTTVEAISSQDPPVASERQDDETLEMTALPTRENESDAAAAAVVVVPLVVTPMESSSNKRNALATDVNDKPSPKKLRFTQQEEGDNDDDDGDKKPEVAAPPQEEKVRLFHWYTRRREWL